MLNSINKSILHGLRNPEVAGYAQEVVLATESLDAVTEVSQFVENLKNAVSEYGEVLYMDGTQNYTASIHQINAEVAAAWLSVMRITEGLCNHTDTEIQQLGKKVYDLTSHFGNITYVSNDYRYGAIVSLLATVTQEMAAKLGIETFVTTLWNGNNAFVTASAARKDCRTYRKARLSSARKAVESALWLLFDLVKTLAAVQGEDKFQAFASRVDELQIERADKHSSTTEEAAQQSEGEEAEETASESEAAGLEQEPKDSAEPES